MAILDLVAGVGPVGLLLRAAAVLLATTAAYWLYRGVQVRLMFRRLQRLGIPIMPHHPILGHLLAVGKYMAALPSDCHGDYMMLEIQSHWRELFPGLDRCPPVAYIDVWPFSAPLIISLDPVVSAQFTQDVSLVKAPEQKRFLYPLTRNRDLSSYEGTEWKVWRRRFNPGFSPQNITARIPDLVEEVEVFVQLLRDRAGKKVEEWGAVFPLEDLTVNLTLDVIGRFVLGQRLHEQSGTLSPLSSALLDSLPRLRFYTHIGNIFTLLSPWRLYKLWRNERAITDFLTPLIQSRLDATLRLSSDSDRASIANNKTLVDLTIRSLEEEKAEELASNPNADPRIVPGPDFIANAVGNINTFLFAGHDTTATTICWALHALETHPAALARLRAELDAVLGADDPSAAAVAARLRANPNLANALPYTHAVIRETLRRYTNVGTLRRGQAGFALHGPPGSGRACEGVAFPTEGFLVWDGNYAIHMDPALWHRADEFLPERWLLADAEGEGGAEKEGAREMDPLRPPHNAYRPFEMGPRNCIGQHLAMTEMKLVLAMVCREFDVECAWEEWDRVTNRKGSPDMIDGDRCYQVSKEGPPHVKDGMPVHVRLRNHIGAVRQ